MSSEIIHWQELTPEQRNACVHEKVMNLPIDTGMCDHRYGVFEVTCPVCQSSWQEHTPDRPHIHGKSVPPYTTSMDAASKMLLYTAFNSRAGISDLALLVREVFMMQPGEIYSIDPFFTLGIVNGWTPEFLCVACLRACGYEVINER